MTSAGTCWTRWPRRPGRPWPTSTGWPPSANCPARSWPPCPRPATDDREVARVAAGLLRVALDRTQALGRADGEPRWCPRGAGGKIILLATDPALLDPAEAIGRMADHLVAERRRRRRAADPGRAGPPQAPAHLGPGRGRPDGPARARGPERLLRLAAALAQAPVWPAVNCTAWTCPPLRRSGIALTGAGGVQGSRRRRSATGSGPGSLPCPRCRNAPGWTS